MRLVSVREIDFFTINLVVFVFPLYPVLFYVFAALTVAAGVMVVTARNPVHAVLFLVLTFFTTAVLWMLLRAEFLSLVLIFVYVGAVMTLFLFVIMMLDIDRARFREKFVHFLPIGLLILIALVGLMAFVVSPAHLSESAKGLQAVASDYNNTAEMGTLLYTDYIFPFEVAGLILLVAIIAAITLAFHGRKRNTKSQKIGEQQAATKQSRLKVVSMKTENKQ